MRNIKSSLFALISFIILLSVLYYPKVSSEYTPRYVTTEWKDRRWGYGEYTYLKREGRRDIFYGVGGDGGDILVYYGYGQPELIRAPASVGSSYIDSVYFTDSIVYVVGNRGQAYVANLESERIMYIFDFHRLLNLSKIWGDYHVLWGNKKGEFYLLLNSTIFHFYRDYEILDTWRYNFTGYCERTYYWNDGFILVFTDFKSYHAAYYVKNGSVLWSVPIHSPYYIWKNFIYLYDGSILTVYRDGKNIRSLEFSGNIIGIKRIQNLTFLVTYFTGELTLYVLDENFYLSQKVNLFRLHLEYWMEKNYNAKTQRMEIYPASHGYTLLIHSYQKIYIPMRVIHLDSSFHVNSVICVRKTPYFSRIYPVGDHYVATLTEYPYLSIFQLKYEVHVDFLAWLNYKALIILFSAPFIAYISIGLRRAEKLRKEAGKP